MRIFTFMRPLYIDRLCAMDFSLANLRRFDRLGYLNSF
ncbi:hypothetical protein D1AOALGA4SA_3348 [Olavius algarvensis Delta 1 endosymbiont]|nr:hypothetical protein D1AOALGA4SA_3348 [Olavius algarvensis Delta 1 endosymbiont]